MSSSSTSDDEEKTLSELAKMYKKSTSKCVAAADKTITVAVKMQHGAVDHQTHRCVNVIPSTAMPCKRSAPKSRERQEKVGEILFKTLSECKMYFLCGKHRKFVSPCVAAEQLGPYTLIYEEWQATNPQDKHKKGAKLWFNCKRQRKFRLKKGARLPANRIRKPKNKKETIGCDCKARYISILQSDGSVRVEFFGKHNHEVQNDYLLHHMNPVRTCEHIREIVDSKLLAGVQRTHQIKLDVLCDLLAKRSKHSNFSMLRAYNMAFAIKPSQIRNQRAQLGLSNTMRLHKCV